MSYANQDIHNAGGPGSSAEPSMEEILASIRRILKEDEPGKPAEPASTAAPFTAQVDMDDDVLVLDESMIARPADISSATTPPIAPAPADEDDAIALPHAGEPIHFSSEPVPFAGDDPQAARAIPEPVFDLPETIEDEAPPAAEPHAPAAPPEADPEPEPPRAAWAPWPSRNIPDHHEQADRGRLWNALPAEPTPGTIAADPEPEPEPEPEPATAYEPDHPEEPAMNDSADNAFQPPESLISDKTTDAAASSIGALVRSMTTEKSVAITKASSITIEDIVREEIRPLLKAWLDSHLPSLVERIVRAEIERVINRSVV